MRALGAENVPVTVIGQSVVFSYNQAMLQQKLIPLGHYVYNRPPVTANRYPLLPKDIADPRGATDMPRPVERWPQACRYLFHSATRSAFAASTASASPSIVTFLIPSPWAMLSTTF